MSTINLNDLEELVDQIDHDLKSLGKFSSDAPIALIVGKATAGDILGILIEHQKLLESMNARMKHFHLRLKVLEDKHG